MSYVNYDKVTRNVDSIYKAVLIGAQRAVEVAEQAAQQARTLPEKPTTYAIKEL
ncbi:MAG TPA: DNA-directed RNA polymerase subunit omega, partial [Candidatus Omnitrophica bacterium]|nr:DNA-directed RNA polymerase subunit omega [Candidatus Omnitrophota bacterium]